MLGTAWLDPVGTMGSGTWDCLWSGRTSRIGNWGGSSILVAAERFAWERGARRIRMTVLHVRDTLIAWYERRGYRATGETEPFPYGDDRFGRPLRDDLHFLVLGERYGSSLHFAIDKWIRS